MKTILGFVFNGVTKKLWLEEAKCEKLLTTLHGWIKAVVWGSGGIPFKQFETTVATLRHAFTAITAGVGLLSPCNCILARKPKVVWLNWNKQAFVALKGCHTLLRESTKDPTRCRELVAGWPEFDGIVNASSYGVGGVVLGELWECILTVFRCEWPEGIRAVVRSFRNPTGSITNSDLEMAGMLLLWLVIEGRLGGEMSCTLQQQHANGGLGFASGFSKISGRRTFCTSTCPATQNKQDMPIDDTAYRGDAECRRRCPVLVFCEQPGLALYIRFDFSHSV